MLRSIAKPKDAVPSLRLCRGLLGAELFEAHFDARDRALTVHEAGHAVVARMLGAQVVFVEIDLMTGDGRSHSQTLTSRSITSRSALRAAEPSTLSTRGLREEPRSAT